MIAANGISSDTVTSLWPRSKRFIELEIKPNVKGWKTVESVLRLHVEPHWGDRPIQDIRRSDVHELLDGLVELRKNADRARSEKASISFLQLGR